MACGHMEGSAGLTRATEKGWEMMEGDGEGADARLRRGEEGQEGEWEWSEGLPQTPWGLSGQECEVGLDGGVRGLAEGAGVCKVVPGRSWVGHRAARSAELVNDWLQIPGR